MPSWKIPVASPDRMPIPFHAVCADCGNRVRLARGAFKPHNWGMRLCPGSWQLASDRDRVARKGAA